MDHSSAFARNESQECNNLACNLFGRLGPGVHDESGSSIRRQALSVERIECIGIFRQRPGIVRTARACRAAAVQQLLHRDVEEHHMGPIGSQQVGILRLNEGAT